MLHSSKIAGLLYIATGLLVMFAELSITGAMLGITTPMFTISSLLIPPLFAIGPSLLVLSGFIALGPNTRRIELSLLASSTIVVALAAWTMPRIGWRYSAWLVLEPAVLGFAMAWFILVLIRKEWITVAVGSVLSSPFTLFGAVYLVYRNVFGPSPYSATELYLIVPGIFVFLSFVSALLFRRS